MKSFIYLFIVLIFFSWKSSMAQPYVDLANVQYTSFNKAPMENNMNASVIHSAWSGSFFLPLPLKNNNRLILGADNISVKVDYSDADTSFTSRLSSTSVQIGLLKQWKNPNWNTIFILIPRQAADFRDVLASDRQLGGAVINTFSWKKDLKLKFGLYYNREFFGNYFMPLAGLDWKVNDRINIWGLMPGSLNIAYKLNTWMTCGIKYQSITATYRAEGHTGDDYIREGHTFWSDQQLSLKGELYLLNNLVFSAGAGMTVFHYLQQYNKHHKKLSYMSDYQQSRDRGFVYAGLAFRVKTD
ncbi:MAG: DUF6268 family outer membrane beta-barrel protein [Bacteroidales bacterium]